MAVTIRGIIKKFNKKLIKYRFTKLKNKDFTIICNNCWAGHIYQQAQIPYNTPTVGLFFYMPCYIQFLENLEYFLKQELVFLETSKYEIANKRRIENWYPIAKLDTIEIHFLHYDSEEEASEKWNKRKKRINNDNLFVVGSERDLCDEEIIRRFQKLKFKNKIFFTANAYKNNDSLIHIKDYEDDGIIGNIYAENGTIYKYFNVIKWLNNPK